MIRWFVICEYDDVGDYEVVAQGSENEAKSFFQSRLSSESKDSGSDVRNITDYQFEVWIEQHYQNNMKPGRAYTVKMTDSLPSKKRH